MNRNTLAAPIGRAGLWLEGLVRPRTRHPVEDVRSVLVLEYMLALGSCVHMTPLYEVLKRCRPELEVTVATRGLCLEVLRHSPYVDHLIETPDPLKHLGAAAGSLTRQLKERGIDPDCCLTGLPDQRTRISLLGAWVCRGWRGGYAVQSALLQRPLVVDRSRSQIANNLRLASMLGCDVEAPEPRVFFNEAEAKMAIEMVREASGGGRPVLAAVTQNSGGQRTGWHDERWVSVLRHAWERLGYAVIYVGTGGDVAAIERLRGLAGGIGVSIAGRTTVNELASMLAVCDLVVALDTGTMHVGRGVGVPMVALGPSWQKPVEWMPLGLPQVRILRGKDRVGVPDGYRLDEISAEAVIAAMEELAMLYPPGEQGRRTRLQAGLSQVERAAV